MSHLSFYVTFSECQDATCTLFSAVLTSVYRTRAYNLAVVLMTTAAWENVFLFILYCTVLSLKMLHSFCFPSFVFCPLWLSSVHLGRISLSVFHWRMQFRWERLQTTFKSTDNTNHVWWLPKQFFSFPLSVAPHWRRKALPSGKWTFLVQWGW